MNLNYKTMEMNLRFKDAINATALNPTSVESIISHIGFHLRNYTYYPRDQRSATNQIFEILNPHFEEHWRRNQIIPGVGALDFYFENGLAIEIRAHSEDIDVFKQMKRYCQSPKVTALLLISVTPCDNWPESINERPFHFLKINKK